MPNCFACTQAVGILASGLTLCRTASTFNSQIPVVLCAGSPRHPWQRYLGFWCCGFFRPVPPAIPGEGTWASLFFQHACSPTISGRDTRAQPLDISGVWSPSEFSGQNIHVLHPRTGLQKGIAPAPARQAVPAQHGREQWKCKGT